MTGAGVEGFEAEVVEDEEIGAAEASDQAGMAPVASGERQVAAELRPAMIEDRVQRDNQDGNRATIRMGMLCRGACEGRA